MRHGAIGSRWQYAPRPRAAIGLTCGFIGVVGQFSAENWRCDIPPTGCRASPYGAESDARSAARCVVAFDRRLAICAPLVSCIEAPFRGAEGAHTTECMMRKARLSAFRLISVPGAHLSRWG